MERENKNNMPQKRDSNPFSVPEKFKQATSPFIIDGYDSKILEDRAYLNLDNEMLKLEYRINQLEEDLMIINDEIKAAINIDDTSRLEFLKTKKTSIENDLRKLNEKYYDLGAMSKFTTILSYMFRKKAKNSQTLKEKFTKFVQKYIFSVFSKRLNFTFGLRESLQKLSDINRSVDELISLRIPFGGLTGRYEKLTSYINKANDIHAGITKNIKEFEGQKDPIKISGMGAMLDIRQ